MVTQQKVLD